MTNKTINNVTRFAGNKVLNTTALESGMIVNLINYMNELHLSNHTDVVHEGSGKWVEVKHDKEDNVHIHYYVGDETGCTVLEYTISKSDINNVGDLISNLVIGISLIVPTCATTMWCKYWVDKVMTARGMIQWKIDQTRSQYDLT